jgi:hypothetical protein
MSATLIKDPVLACFRQALDDLYGDRLERVVLFAPARAAIRTPSPTTTWRCSCTT